MKIKEKTTFLIRVKYGNSWKRTKNDDNNMIIYIICILIEIPVRLGNIDQRAFHSNALLISILNSNLMHLSKARDSLIINLKIYLPNSLVNYFLEYLPKDFLFHFQ